MTDEPRVVTRVKIPADHVCRMPSVYQTPLGTVIECPTCHRWWILRRTFNVRDWEPVGYWMRRKIKKLLEREAKNDG